MGPRGIRRAQLGGSFQRGGRGGQRLVGGPPLGWTGPVVDRRADERVPEGHLCPVARDQLVELADLERGRLQPTGWRVRVANSPIASGLPPLADNNSSRSAGESRSPPCSRSRARAASSGRPVSGRSARPAAASEMPAAVRAASSIAIGSASSRRATNPSVSGMPGRPSGRRRPNRAAGGHRLGLRFDTSRGEHPHPGRPPAGIRQQRALAHARFAAHHQPAAAPVTGPLQEGADRRLLCLPPAQHGPIPTADGGPADSQQPGRLQPYGGRSAARPAISLIPTAPGRPTFGASRYPTPVLRRRRAS
jgi:hypothetical protein